MSADKASTPSVTCTPPTDNSCTYKCEGGIEYDLSRLKPPLGPFGKDQHAQDNDHHDYYWKVCLEPEEKCPTSQVADPAAIQTWPVATTASADGSTVRSGDTGCAVIGDRDPAQTTCEVDDPSNPDQGLKCKYEGGDDQRDVTFRWICDQTGQDPEASSNGLSYEIQHRHPVGCGSGAGPGPGPTPAADSPPPPSPPVHPSGHDSPPPPTPPDPPVTPPTPHPPLAPVTCSNPPIHKAGDAAAGSCTYVCGDATYDMSPLLKWTSGHFTESDVASKTTLYHWGVCGYELPKALQCTTTTAAAAADADEGSGGFPPPPPPPGGGLDEPVAATRFSVDPANPGKTKCDTIGVWKDATGVQTPCHLADPARPNEGLVCPLYSGEKGGNSLYVHYQCAKERAADPVVEQVGHLTYRATVTGPEACGVPPSYFTLIVISSSVGGFLLLVVGLYLYCKCCRRSYGYTDGDSSSSASRSASSSNKPRRGAAASASSSARAHGGGGGGGSSSSSSSRRPRSDLSAVVAGAGVDVDDRRRALLEDTTFDRETTTTEASMPANTGGYQRPASPPPAAPSKGGGGYGSDGGFGSDGGDFGGEDVDEELGYASAVAVEGLVQLMQASGLEQRTAAAGLWCAQNGWASVAHLKSGGASAVEELLATLRLKADGARGKRLKKELKKDQWGWDAHAAAAQNAARDREVRAGRR